MNGGGHADHGALPGFDTRYLARTRAQPRAKKSRPAQSNLSVGRVPAVANMVHMQSNLSRAPMRSAARCDLLERRLRRYRPPFQRAVRALAMRHSRVADFAVSFPALLFALAVPRPGLDPTRAIARA